MRFVTRCLSETWRLLRFIAVGLAWSSPFLLSAFANGNPGVSTYPSLARVVETVQMPLLAAAPVAAVVGIVAVAVLSKRDAKLDAASAAPVLAFVLFGVAMVLAMTDRLPFSVLAMALMAGLAVPVLVLVGVGVTSWTVGRASMPAAAIILAVWFAMSSAMWFAGQRAPGMEDDLGAGLLLAVVGLAVLATTLTASIFAFGATAIRGTLPTELSGRLGSQKALTADAHPDVSGASEVDSR